MKKLFLVLTAALALGTASVSAESVIKSYANPGELTVQAGLGLNFYWNSIGLSVVPGAELGLTQFKISDQFPINIGVAGRGYYSSYEYKAYSNYTFGYAYYGLGAFGTAHWSPKFLKLEGEFWSHLDYYVGLGLGFTVATPTGTYAKYYKDLYGTDYTEGYGGGFGLAAYSGVSYFINNNLAVFVEGSSFTSLGGTIVGVSFKL